MYMDDHRHRRARDFESKDDSTRGGRFHASGDRPQSSAAPTTPKNRNAILGARRGGDIRRKFGAAEGCAAPNNPHTARIWLYNRDSGLVGGARLERATSRL